MRPRDGVVRRGEPAQDRRHEIAHVGGALDLLRSGPGDEHVARHPLLEQQVARRDDRIGVEALHHGVAVEDVADGHQGHALVMRHVALHDRHRGPIGQPAGRVVDGLAEAVLAARSGRRESGEVPDGCPRLDHRPERGRIRGDHDVLTQAALETEARHAEARILVGLLEIPGVEGRLGDPPGHVEPGRIAHLACDHELVGVLEQAAGRRVHHESRHQVLEHRP